MADRNREDIRFRLTAEGIEEVKAAFRQVEAEAAKSGKQVEGLAVSTTKSSRDAQNAIQLLSREIGITLPQSVTRYISSLRGIQPAMAIAFKAAVVFVLTDAILRTLPAIAKFIDGLRGIKDEVFEVEKSIEDFQRQLFAPQSIEAARGAIANLTLQLQDLRIAYDELIEKEGLLARIAPKFFSNAEIRDNLAKQKKLQEQINEAEETRIELGRKKPKEDESGINRAVAAARQLEEARLDAIKAAADNEITFLRARNKLLSDEEQRAFDQGLINVDSFYSDRQNRIESEGAEELAILARQHQALNAQLEKLRTSPLAKGELRDQRAKDELEIEKDIAKIEGDAAVKSLDIQNQLADNQAARLEMIRKTGREALQNEAALLAAEGNRFAAERKALEAQVAGLQRQAGERPEKFDARARRLLTAGTAGINFEEIAAEARQAFESLDAERREIERDVQSGLLFQFEATEKIAELEKQRLPVLDQIAIRLEAAAEATGSEEARQQARDLTEALKQLAVTSDLAGQAMSNFKADVENALTSDLTNFFTQGIMEAESFGDAMRMLALSVVDSLRRIASQMLANLAIQQLLGLIGGAAGAGSGIGIGGGGGPAIAGGGGLSIASGGLVRGPGSGTSDSIPARLSDMEYVVRSAIVKQPGMLDFLEQLNRGGRRHLRSLSEFSAGGLVQKFADGGLVDSSGAPGAPGPSGNMHATFDLNEAFVMKRLEASGALERAVIRIADRRRKAMNNALGRGVQ